MHQQITLIGNLGQDPIVRETNGRSVTNFSVATSRTWTDDQGQRQERRTWFQVAAWGRQGETCAQYLAKGHRVFVEGEMQAPRVYQDSQGNHRCDLQVRARHVKFLTVNGDANREEAPPPGK